MTAEPTLHLETLAVSAGRPDRVVDAPLNTPITPASTYHADTERRGDPTGRTSYGRYGNPGWTALEDAVGALEGGRALAFASGMAAAHAVFELLPPHGVLVLQRQCYLGVAGTAREYAERYGLQVRVVDAADTAEVLAAADGADLIWLESPANPTMEVVELTGIAAGKPPGTLMLVDNTFASPVLQQPLALGADLVMHSATKLLSGHSDALCGVLVTAEQHQDELQRLESVRRNHGATPGTLEAYLVLRGLRTLPLRVRQAQLNAQALAETLAEHPAVRRVRYPGLPGDPFHHRASAQMQGFGSLLSIELDDAEHADAMIGRLRLWVHATSLGGVESTLERRRRWSGESDSIPAGLIRLSVGIEHLDDLRQDLLQALEPG